MEREANYVAVGAFVVLLLVMGVLFVYWYSESREHRDFVRYEIYFDGTVSGLSQGEPVRYLGVDVGRVRRIRIDPRAENRVQVIVDIDSTTPVTDRTQAQLSLQGITGLLYIDLEQQRPDEHRRVLAEVPSENYPVIRSVHSDFDQFLSSLPSLTARLSDLLDRTAHVLSDTNLHSVDRLVGNLDQTAAALPDSKRNLDSLINELYATTRSAHELIEDLHGTTHGASADFLSALQELRATSEHLASTSRTLDAFSAENRAQLTSFVNEGLPQIESLVRDSRSTVQQIGELSRSLNQDPSRLLYQPTAGGVTIPP
jgi:phospholipid/cholesterol/gamma-HCH transport system substrate-binding protein